MLSRLEVSDVESDAMFLHPAVPINAYFTSEPLPSLVHLVIVGPLIGRNKRRRDHSPARLSLRHCETGKRLYEAVSMLIITLLSPKPGKTRTARPGPSVLGNRTRALFRSSAKLPNPFYK